MNKKELQYDILKELFNISVGKASSILSEITNKRILLNVPNFKILNIENREFILDEYYQTIFDGTLMVSSISFEKKLTGTANLIFPAKKMKKFISICYNQYENSIYCDTNFTNIDFDIIKEIGNILLNSIIGEFSNYLDINLNYSLPEVKIFTNIDFAKDITHNHANILILYITFIIDDIEIEGAVIIDLTLDSLKELLDKINTIEDEIYG
ncbi:chemotaxis protein CheC [Clostridium sp. LBM24168]